MNSSEDSFNLVERLRADRRHLWIQGERRLAEEYFVSEPELAGDKEAALDFLYGEFCLREELGEDVAPQEYLRRFPQFEAELRPLFEVHCAVEAERLGDTSHYQQLPADERLTF